MNWIDANIKQPKIGQPVFVASPDHDEPLKGALQSDGTWYCPEYDTRFRVTHWMPMPKLPY